MSLQRKARGEDGFTFRFNFIYPVKTETPDWIDSEVNEELLRAYEIAIEKVMDCNDPVEVSKDEP